MSALLFVRDGRTLPYVTVTAAALQTIRERCEKPPFALAAYMALLELANEDRTDRVAVTQKLLSERASIGRTTVQHALTDLERVGLLVVRERKHGGQRLENEYVVVEPGAVDDTLARDTGDPRPRDGQRSQEGSSEPPKGGSSSPKKRAEANGPDRREKIPDDFPDDLRPHAREVMKILRQVAEDHGARKVWPLEVARAVTAHPRHPLVATAHALAAWAVDPPRPVRDVVATYRTFLGRERELASVERLAADGTPTTTATPPAGSKAARDAGKDWRTEQRLKLLAGGGESS